MGAVASGGVRVVNPDVLEQLHIPQRVLDAVTIEEQRELERRERAYRGLKPPLNVNGWTAIVVDDGLATGSSMRAAASALRLQGPAQIIVGVPVAARATCDDLSREVDQVVCVLTPEPFYAVGLWYQDFRQITDEEVRQLLTTLAPPPTRQAA